MRSTRYVQEGYPSCTALSVDLALNAALCQKNGGTSLAHEADPHSSSVTDIQMADKDGCDLHTRVLSSLPSADFSWDDPESDVSLEYVRLLCRLNGVS